MSGAQYLIVLSKFWSGQSQRLAHESEPFLFIEARIGPFDHVLNKHEILNAKIKASQHFAGEYDQMEDIGHTIIDSERLQRLLATPGWSDTYRCWEASDVRSQRFLEVLKAYGLPDEWATDRTSKLWTPGRRQGPKIRDIAKRIAILADNIHGKQPSHVRRRASRGGMGQ